MSGLRITGGALRGRRLSGRGGPNRRPTSERVREAIFSILASRDALDEAQVYDLFAGTGALGFEALSRGAAHVLFVDQDKRALETIDKDIEAFGLAERAQTQRADLKTGLACNVSAASLVLLDPPYTQSTMIVPLLEQLATRGQLRAGAWLVIETAERNPVELPPMFSADRVYRYGDTRVTLAKFE